MDLQFLPYIVVTNPHIKKVYDSYHHAFDTLHKRPPVETIEQNADFTLLLKRLVDEHGQLLPRCLTEVTFMLACAGACVAQTCIPACKMSHMTCMPET